MPEPKKPRVQIEDLPGAQEELTPEEAEAVNGGRLIGTAEPGIIPNDDPSLPAGDPTPDSPLLSPDNG